MNEILDQAREILHSKMDFKEKLVKALSICSDDLNNSFNDYFSREALKDSALLKLLTESLTKEKLKLYKEYIDIGKKEGIIDKSLSTETILKLLEIILVNHTDFDNSNVSHCYLQELQKILFHGILVK